MNSNTKNINQLATHQDTSLIQEAIYQKENRYWIKYSQRIAIRILDKIKTFELSKDRLAKRMDISLTELDKILEGQTNLDLKTLVKLETMLNLDILNI